MSKELSQRARQILAAVIASYTSTAEPVGSASIASQPGIEVSPATVRNVMAQLEDMGYLTQPHVSAGRMPTAKGLRLYVDSILRVQGLDQQIKEKLKETLGEQKGADTAEVLKATTRTLSELSMQVAVVAAPGPRQEVFRHMEFILLSPGLIMVVLVSKAGVVQNRVIEAEPSMGQEDLDKYTRYLNDLLADLTLIEVKDRIVSELARERARFDNLMRQALTLGQKALRDEAGGDIYIEGQSNLIGAPEFSDLDLLRQIFLAFDEKSTLLRLLEKALLAHGVQIFIGSESEMAGLGELTIVSSPYGKDESPLGALAVVGPTRMDYSRVIPIVDYTARLVTRILEKRSQG